MLIRTFTIAFICAIFGVSTVSAGPVLVQTKATIDSSVDIPDRITNECEPLGNKLGEYTLKYARKWLPDAQAVESGDVTEDARVLELSIRGIVAPRGSRWTGRKAVAIRAVAVTNGTPLTSTVIVSSGRGRAFDSTCGILDDVVDDLAERAAKWFANGYKTNFVSKRKPIGSPVAVLTPARFAADSGVSEAVLRECALDGALANRTLASMNTRYPDTIPVTDPGQSGDRRLLTLTIMNIEARSGGSLSGPKTLGLRAALMQDGTEVAHQDIEHTGGGGGIFGHVTASACAILEREAAVLGQMVTKWIVTYDRMASSSEQATNPPEGGAAAADEVATE